MITLRYNIHYGIVTKSIYYHHNLFKRDPYFTFRSKVNFNLSTYQSPYHSVTTITIP